MSLPWYPTSLGAPVTGSDTPKRARSRTFLQWTTGTACRFNRDSVLFPREAYCANYAAAHPPIPESCRLGRHGDLHYAISAQGTQAARRPAV